MDTATEIAPQATAPQATAPQATAPQAPQDAPHGRNPDGSPMSLEQASARRAAGRVAANARLAALALATKRADAPFREARLAHVGALEGEARKAKAREWTGAMREAMLDAVHGQKVSVTLQRAGKRWLATGLTDARDVNGDPYTVRVSGEVSVVDSVGFVTDGVQVTVSLSRRDSRPDKRGKVSTTYTVESFGEARWPNGHAARVALRGRLTASRYQRVAVETL